MQERPSAPNYRRARPRRRNRIRVAMHQVPRAVLAAEQTCRPQGERSADFCSSASHFNNAREFTGCIGGRQLNPVTSPRGSSPLRALMLPRVACDRVQTARTDCRAAHPLDQRTAPSPVRMPPKIAATALGSAASHSQDYPPPCDASTLSDINTQTQPTYPIERPGRHRLLLIRTGATSLRTRGTRMTCTETLSRRACAAL